MAKEQQMVTDGFRSKRPKTKKQLYDYIKGLLGIDVPQRTVTAGHASPLDYIWFAFNADFDKTIIDADAIVWANRGGGKTQSAAIVTLLDCVFKPDIQIRILSGSEYQAGRMYEYFHKFMKKGFEDLVKKVKKTPTQKTIFKNGAMVEVLIQSEKSVRGQHVHKLRCDEIEMFNASVYEAAQYTTISTKGYKGAIEVISTKNTNYGLMAKVLKKSKEQGKRIFKWNVWDVVKRCRKECAECILNTACEGKARKGRGYLRIDDVINQLKRTSKAKFNLEILCSEASQSSGWGYSFGERLY